MNFKLICIFRFLLITAGLHAESDPKKKNKSFQSDREATVDKIVADVKQMFPSLTSNCKPTFMVKSKQFIQTMVTSSDIGKFLLDFMTDKCEKCLDSLEHWPHKAKNAIFLDVGELKVIDIPVVICPTCKCLVYPDVIQYGLLCLHNKVLLSYRMLMELCDQLVIGGSLIDFVTAKVHNNGLSEGLEYDYLNTNLVNIAKMVEGCGIAVLSLLVQDDDLNKVQGCLFFILWIQPHPEDFTLRKINGVRNDFACGRI